MLKVGLTGGIAAGKSVVGEMLVGLGAHLVQADRIAHSLMQPGESRSTTKSSATLGARFSIPTAASTAANWPRSPSARPAPEGKGSSRIEELNRIVHPGVIRSQEEWMHEMGRQDPHAVAIVEAALDSRSGRGQALRPPDRRDLQRGAACRPLRRSGRRSIWKRRARKLTRRMAAQLPDEEKIKAADYVIDNSGSLERTREQVQQVWEKLQAAQ